MTIQKRPWRLCSAVLFCSSLLAMQASAQGDAQLESAAVELGHYRRAAEPIATLPSAASPLSLSQAYLVQQHLADLETIRLGPVVGYKVAYASVAAQKQFRMKEPASGPFFAVQRLENEGAAYASDLRDMLMETEVAFVLSRALDGEPIESVDQLRGFVRSVHPAFDLGDFPFAEGLKPKPADIIAAGVGAHRFVLGPGAAPGSVDLKSLQLRLLRNGEELRNSPASEVMGDPWESLRWFVNAHCRRGHALLPGTVILTGTAAPAYRTKDRAEMRGEYIGDCGPLGQVKLRIE